MSVDVLARFRGDTMRRLVSWHAVVVTAFLVWRAIESTHATASAQGSTFAVSIFGRALALVLVFLGATACVAIAIETFRARRELIAHVLFVAWLAALARRGTFDALDIVYVLLTMIAAAAAFAVRRS